ncbi:hypothetical protein BHE74_00017203 [Ensete ventricosum]|nr:hypothetical protein BHE74_00017203 [Ensete ventricosum]
MDPPCPTPEVGCWSGGVRVGRRRLSSGRAPAPARRSGRVSSRRDPSDGQVSAMVDFAIPLPRRGAGAFIVSVVGPSYLITLLPLRLIMSSYLSTMPLMLAMRCAFAGKECRPYLCQSFMSRAHIQDLGFRGIESDVSKFLGNEMSLSYDSDTGRFLVESRHRPVAILTPPSQNGAQRPLSLSLYSSSRIRIKANGDLRNPFWAISWSRSRSRRPSTSNPKLTTQGIRETEPTMPTCDGDSSSGSGPNPNPNSVPKLSNGGMAPQLKRSRTITASLAPGGAAAVLGPQPPAVGRAATAPLPASRRLTVAVDNPSDVPSNGGVFDRDWYYPSFLGPYAVRPRATGRASSSGPKKLDVPLPPPSSTDRSSAAVSDEEEKEVVERPLVLEEKQGSFPSASRSPPKKNNRFDNNSLILSLGSLLKQLAIANKSIGGGVIVVLAERDKEEMEMDIAKLEFDFMGTSVICRSGSPLILADLKKAFPGELMSYLRFILILADESLEDSVVHSDSRSLATLLLIRDIQSKRLPSKEAKSPLHYAGFSHSSWIREMQQASDKSIIISEILDSRTRNLVSVSRISDYVLSNELVSMALAMVAEDKQINRVLEELFAEEVLLLALSQVNGPIRFIRSKIPTLLDKIMKHKTSIQLKLYLYILQGNEMCIKSAEYYLYEQEELCFYDIMVRARQRKEIVIGYRFANTDLAIINPENKSEVRKWSLDDVFVVISNGD